MKMEILFKEVSLGESFEFHSQLFACVAVKAKLATVVFGDRSSLLSNFVIIKILETTRNSIGRKPGDYEWCPDSGIVIVDRCLPSGS